MRVFRIYQRLLLSAVSLSSIVSCDQSKNAKSRSDESSEEHVKAHAKGGKILTFSERELELKLLKEKIKAIALQLDDDKKYEYLRVPQVTNYDECLPHQDITEAKNKNILESTSKLGVTHFEDIYSLIRLGIWDYVRIEEGYKPLNVLDRYFADDRYREGFQIVPPLPIEDKKVLNEFKRRLELLWNSLDADEIAKIQSDHELGKDAGDILKRLTISQKDKDELGNLLGQLNVRRFN